LFVDQQAPSATLAELANGIRIAVASGAKLINLSLAIMGDEIQKDRELATALDCAEAGGAVVLAAAGNQGRLAVGQLLCHPVTIPVVAVDAAHRLLPDCNFGPVTSGRGVAALGHQVIGYASGGGMTTMSGTSVATAVATGTLAQLWSTHPSAGGAEIRAAVARLGPRNTPIPPLLDLDALLAVLDWKGGAIVSAPSIAERRMLNHATLQGEMIMTKDNGLTRLVDRGTGPTRGSVNVVRPADNLDESAEGLCTCTENQDASSGFVYAIGTVEAEYPNVAIEREMQILAQALLEPGWQSDSDVPIKLTEDRSWQHAVLSAQPEMTRYIARQLLWRLTIEDLPAFVLRPHDPRDFETLINCLRRPKYPKLDDKAGTKKKGSGKRGTNGSVSIGPLFGPPQDLDVVVGVRGATTPEGIEVLVDQIFTIPPERLAPRGLAFFSQLSDNYGLTDADRAYNFLAARYNIPPESLDEIEKFGLAGVPIISSRLSGAPGRVVRVIFTLRGTNRPVEKKYFVRVDATYEFPIIVNPWQQYVERGEAL
jgi:hypothetical protein